MSHIRIFNARGFHFATIQYSSNGPHLLDVWLGLAVFLVQLVRLITTTCKIVKTRRARRRATHCADAGHMPRRMRLRDRPPTALDLRPTRCLSSPDPPATASTPLRWCLQSTPSRPTASERSPRAPRPDR